MSGRDSVKRDACGTRGGLNCTIQDVIAGKLASHSILTVSERTVREWLSRMDKDAKEPRDKRIFELWMACNTHEEISELIGIPRQTITDSFAGFGNVADLGKSDQTNANHAEEGFQVPIYNVPIESPPRLR